MHRPAPLPRRALLKGAAAGALAAPAVVPGRALGLGAAVAPSERVGMGVIGCGDHAVGYNFPQILGNPAVQLVALCDVDEGRLKDAAARAEKRGASVGFRTVDFRELIRRQDVDAVYNGTPDHWHVIPSIMALKAGKDVICEKPLTLTIEEGRALVAAAKATGRITQTASENRSIDTYLRLIALVRGGRIGALKHIRVSLPAGHGIQKHGPDPFKPQPPPEGFRYDLWLGQAPEAPYCPGRCHWNFRWNLAYSGGMLTDWGAHLIDLAQWGNDTEATGPVEVEGTGVWPPRDALYNTATTFDLRYRYANGVTLNVVSRQPGIRFEGAEGWLECQGWRGKLAASRPELAADPVPEPKAGFRPAGPDASRSWKGGEHRNFIDGVKSRTPCYAPFEIGHRTIAVAHIGNIAMLLGRKLAWDPERERFAGDDEANRMLGRAQRAPWTIGHIDAWLKKDA
jgi:predicted dehydrogenase